jgi:hypothetical protein
MIVHVFVADVYACLVLGVVQIHPIAIFIGISIEGNGCCGGIIEGVREGAVEGLIGFCRQVDAKICTRFGIVIAIVAGLWF